MNLYGRPDQIQDPSGLRSLGYDNTRWFLETESWTSGLLQGFKLIRDLDGRGRDSLLRVEQDDVTRYSAVPTYRHDSESLEKLTVSGPGFSTVEIHYSGDGGVADGIEYRVNLQPTFTWSRQRGAGGRLEAIATGKPEFNQSWTPDAFGRVHQLTCANGVTTFTYADNGSLGRAHRAGEDREYVFTDRGELTLEKLNGNALAANFDPKKSGASTFRENLRQFTVHGTAHAEATMRVYANTNLVSTVTSPFAVTLTETHYPGLSQSNGPFLWKVTGERTGVDYIGGKAIADLEGEAWLPDAEENLIISFGRRDQDSLHNFEWNAADQLLEVEQRYGPLRVENVYDGNQRRVEKRVYTTGNLQRSHSFVYDGWLPVVEEVTNSSGGLLYRNLYVYGAGPDGRREPGIGATGQLALIIHQPAQGPVQLSAPVYNHRLDIIGLVCVESGNTVAQYDYEPFGRPTAASGSRAHHNPFRFATSYFDAEVGLNYFGYRHYDPRSKQWLSRDPIGEAGGLNLYGYANNDPINGIDFLGLDAIRTSADGGVWWVIKGTGREVYLGVANVEPRLFGLMTSVSDSVQLNPAFGGGTVSRNHLNKLAAGQFFGHTWLFGQKYPTSASSQDRQIRNIIDERLNPRGETRIGADTLISAEEHAFRSNRALATSGLLLGSSLSGYTDEGAQIAEFNANLYARSMLPSAVGTRAAQVFYAAESGYILGNPDSSGLDRGLAAFNLGLMFTTLPKGTNSRVDDLAIMSRRLERLGYDQANINRLLQSIRNGEQVVVVGENMRRVNAVAHMVENAGGRAVTYAPRNWSGLTRNSLEANRSWIRYWAKDKGVSVLDIGRQPTPRTGGPSPFYGVENRSLHLWDIYTPFNNN